MNAEREKVRQHSQSAIGRTWTEADNTFLLDQLARADHVAQQVFDRQKGYRVTYSGRVEVDTNRLVAEREKLAGRRSRGIPA